MADYGTKKNGGQFMTCITCRRIYYTPKGKTMKTEDTKPRKRPRRCLTIQTAIKIWIRSMGALTLNCSKIRLTVSISIYTTICSITFNHLCFKSLLPPSIFVHPCFHPFNTNAVIDLIKLLSIFLIVRHRLGLFLGLVSSVFMVLSFSVWYLLLPVIQVIYCPPFFLVP